MPPTLTRPFSRVDIVRMATLLPGPFTVEMYHKLGELGVFDEDDRVELLDGQIVEMSPIGDAHAACVYRLNNLLARRTGGDVGVSPQNPVVLDPRWEPQPDIAVLRRPGGFGGAWRPSARDVVLVIEVADSSLERDRDVKIPHYARTGIPEAWLVDLNGDVITCYRRPGPDGYGEQTAVSRGATLQPSHVPEVIIAADEILG
jgi:Uma2 family endonuclease